MSKINKICFFLSILCGFSSDQSFSAVFTSSVTDSVGCEGPSAAPRSSEIAKVIPSSRVAPSGPSRLAESVTEEVNMASFSSQKKFNFKACLDSISYQDKEGLEGFFKYFICQESFGYVIFGSKPMIYAGFDLNISNLGLAGLCKIGPIKYAPIVFYFKYWQKYQHFFSITNYFFNISKSLDSSYYRVVFINKKAFLSAVVKYLDFFKKVLGEQITPEILLEQISNNPDDILDNVLKGHHELLGILLGYGLHNSLQFQRRRDLSRSLKLNYKPPYDLNIIYAKYPLEMTFFYGSDRRLFYIQPPYFCEDLKNPESRQVRTEYLKKWKELHELYSKNSFLEVTLKALMSQ